MPMKPCPDEVMHLAAIMDVDVVPMRELVGDDLRRCGIVGGQVLDRLVGEDHAPAEGHAGRVALEYLDLVRRVAKLHRDREIEAGRPAADAGDLHAARRGSWQSWQRRACGARHETQNEAFACDRTTCNRAQISCQLRDRIGRNMAQQRACRTEECLVRVESATPSGWSRLPEVRSRAYHPKTAPRS